MVMKLKVKQGMTVGQCRTCKNLLKHSVMTFKNKQGVQTIKNLSDKKEGRGTQAVEAVQFSGRQCLQGVVSGSAIFHEGVKA